MIVRDATKMPPYVRKLKKELAIGRIFCCLAVVVKLLKRIKKENLFFLI